MVGELELDLSRRMVGRTKPFVDYVLRLGVVITQKDCSTNMFLETMTLESEVRDCG